MQPPRLSMPRLIVTDHAIARYVERLGGTEADALAALSSPAIERAVEFGARAIRISGHGSGRGRIILEFTPVSAVVVTVLPIGEIPPRTLHPCCQGGPPPIAHERAHFPASISPSPLMSSEVETQP